MDGFKKATYEEVDIFLTKIVRGGYEPLALPIRVFGVPKNGLVLAQRLKISYPSEVRIVYKPTDADILLDDVLASGQTMKHFTDLNPEAEVRVMFDKRKPEIAALGYIRFPWEDYKKDTENIVVQTIEMIGDDPKRPGLVETPDRVVRSWKELYSGYQIKNPGKILEKLFQAPGSSDEMIIVKNIKVFSTCEHHLIPFFGQASVGYIPSDDWVVGASKIPRLVDVYARRLQIQERLTHEIGSTFWEYVKPKGFGIVMECQHLCMKSRGVNEPNSSLITSAMHGIFRKDSAVRTEFLNRIGLK